MKKRVLSVAFTVVFPMLMNAQNGETVNTVGQERELEEVVVTADPKQVGKLSEQPVSYNTIGGNDLNRLGGMNRLKDASAFVPNLFMPDYGSTLTSSMYIRGIGSRINTPAVGMYVDDVAYVDKSAFDFSLADVQRIEVLRGPQSTMYGRNAMGGLLKVYTHNPLDTRVRGRQYQLRLGGATEEALRYVNFYTAHPFGNDGAVSLSGFYKGSDGYNRNTFLNRRSNGAESGGGRFRVVYNPERHRNFTLDFQTGLEYVEEDGYDYYNIADGNILENELGGYRRALFNTSLRLETVQKPFVLTSITAYQYLTDRMFMDQDFTSANVFTLNQRQKMGNLSEELTLRSHADSRLQWVAGGRISQQWLRTNAPVRFDDEGIQTLIQSGIDKGFEAANAAMNPMGMNIAMNITDDAMIVDGLFKTPVTNAAAFAQLTYKDLLLKGLDLTAGFRYDYERMKMHYNSGAVSNFDFVMTRGGRPMINQSFTSESRYHGDMKNEYEQFLPKTVLSYRFGKNDNMVYASAAKGFRSGGYNIQMFSDLIQESLKNEMMRTLAADPTLGAAMARNMTIGDDPSADNTTVFKPETSWNYEVGTHLSLLDQHLTAQASLFYIRTKDQQIARFAESGLGRQMVNAGESESYGGEITLNGWFNICRNVMSLSASYGFTHATFIDYDAGTSKDVTYNYDGNYVPFAPQHNFAVTADYVMPMKCLASAYLTIGADFTGCGKTYWTEDNNISEPLYLLLGAHIGLSWNKIAVNFWGKNLTGKEYVPFAFVSMGQTWVQTSRPRQFGVDVSFKF